MFSFEMYQIQLTNILTYKLDGKDLLEMDSVEEGG